MKGASSLINIAGSTSANKILPVDSGLQSLPKSEQIIPRMERTLPIIKLPTT